MTDVGDVHAQVIIAIGQFFQGDRIVKVLGIRGVNREDLLIAQIQTARHFILGDLQGHLVGLAFQRVPELQGQAVADRH